MAEILGNIRETIRNLAAVFVLSTVLLRLLPGETCARYLRFFLGLILVIYLLRPIASALLQEDVLADVLHFGGDEFAYSASEDGGPVFAAFETADSGELKESIAAVSAGEWEEIFSACRGEILQQMDILLADLGVSVTDISVDSGEQILTVVLSENTAEKKETDEAGTEENETENRAVQAVRVEIPVISVFSGTGECDPEPSENGREADREEDSALKAAAGTPELSGDEIAAEARARLAEQTGLGEDAVDVKWAE